MKIKCWTPKPQGYFNQLKATLLGIKPELKFKDLLFSSQERFGLECETTGTVEIDIGVIQKDFHLHGVALYTEQ